MVVVSFGCFFELMVVGDEFRIRSRMLCFGNFWVLRCCVSLINYFMKKLGHV